MSETSGRKARPLLFYIIDLTPIGLILIRKLDPYKRYSNRATQFYAYLEGITVQVSTMPHKFDHFASFSTRYYIFTRYAR